MSDIFILVITTVIVRNLLIKLIMSVQKLLEKRLSMRQLSALLKTVTVYNFLVTSVIVAVILYKSTFCGKIFVEGEDFSYFYIIGKETVSTSTLWGNHWILYILLGV